MSAETPEGMQVALRSAARNFQRALVAAAVLGVLGFIGLAVAGHAVAGVLLCVGLGLGGVNSRMVQRSLGEFIKQGDPNKRKLMLGVLRRLMLVSAVALGIAFLYQPDGWVVLVGLAVFQVIVMGSVFGGLYKEVRRA
ncbi:MAG: ATP synthase subunit I [Actinomycetes bacterium]